MIALCTSRSMIQCCIVWRTASAAVVTRTASTLRGCHFSHFFFQYPPQCGKNAKHKGHRSDIETLSGCSWLYLRSLWINVRQRRCGGRSWFAWDSRKQRTNPECEVVTVLLELDTRTGGLASIPRHFTWSLWWKNWHCRMFSSKYFDLCPSLLFYQCCPGWFIPLSCSL